MSILGSLQPAADAVRAVEQLAEVEWDRVDPADLPEAAVVLARVRAQAEAALVAVTEQLEATDAASAAGWASTKDFLTAVTGGRKGSGSTLVRVAKQTAALAQVREAFAAGDLSLAQASVIGARTASLPWEYRQQAATRMVDMATLEGRDATDLDRAFPGMLREELDRDGRMRIRESEREQAERAAHHNRYLSLAPDVLGGVRIAGYTTVEDAELFKTTLMPLAAPVTTDPGACGGRRRDPDAPRYDEHGHSTARPCPDPHCDHSGRDPRDHGARFHDALVAACRMLQASEDLPQAHGTTARIIVTLSHDQLLQKVEDTALPGRLMFASGYTGTGLLGSGESLSASAVRRLACDAEIIPAVLGSNSQLLDVGRTQRLVTPALWNALVLRDQHCAFPGCQRLPIACDAHHIIHWADGGPTSLDNLVLLCRRHHTIAHHTPWTVTLDPDTRRPVWTPPPQIDVRTRLTYHPATRPPPHAA